MSAKQPVETSSIWIYECLFVKLGYFEVILQDGTDLAVWACLAGHFTA